MDSKTNYSKEGNSAMQFTKESTFELLNRGEKEIVLSDEYKDAVLILGNTGSGKSTFTQWIAGDNEKLMSIEVKEGSGEFILIDNNRISNSTIQSKTIFPYLQIDAETNTAFYDCPGFSDTRNTIIDIASTYFIKKLVDHARSVKMIFVISHPSLRKGVDRQDFMKLMKHVTHFLKHIDKFRSSIAIVATKVDNVFIKRGRNYSLVPDDIVIGAIGDFLLEAKQDLLNTLKRPDISTNDQIFYRNTIKLINIFLVKEGNAYLNIGIFRRPDESGPLSKIPLLQEGKAEIKKIIYKTLNFTVKDRKDFGYTLSEKSKNEIHDLVEEINKNVWSSGKFILETTQLYYHDLVEQVRTTVKSLISCPFNFKFDKLEAQTFSSKFASGYETISSLVEDLQNSTSIEELAVKLNSTVHGLGINVPESYLLNITNEGKYFNFLQVVSDKELNTWQWGVLFKETLMYFSDSKIYIQNDVEETSKDMNKLLSDSTNTIHKHYYKKKKVLEIQRLPDELNKDLTIIRAIQKEVENITPSTELFQVIHKLQFMLRSLGLNFSKSRLVIIINWKNYLNFLHVVSGINLANEKMLWICPLENAILSLNDSIKWYKYLNSLYSMLSQYKVQRNIVRYNVANIDDWGKDGKRQGIVIFKSNFQKFLNKTADYMSEHNNIKSIDVTDLRLEELNNVFSLALKQKLHVKCEGPYVFIMGEYIKFQDVNNELKTSNKPCWGSSINEKYKYINIFALNTVFIDKDLSFPGLELSISVIAPKWEVIGSRELVLRGSDVSSQEIKKPESKRPLPCSGLNGADGNPGKPGGPGGSFFGVAEYIINGESLTITTNGGNGGHGQDGEDGNCGIDGQPATEPASDTPCDKNYCVGRSDCKHINYTVTHIGLYPGTISITKNIFELYGKAGTTGGKGGNGGRGGHGGKPGDIILFELHKKSGVVKYKNTGKQGENGLGGGGGPGGHHGTSLVAICTHKTILMVDYSSNPLTWIINNKTIERTAGTKGKGSDGTNAKDREPPRSANIIRSASIINEYKQYLRQNLNNQLKTYPLNNFLNQIDSNKDVISAYDTLGLVGEFKGLEAQVHNISSEIDVQPFYRSLLQRVIDYAQHPEEFQVSIEEKKVLGYLYTAILGRIQNHKENLESNLVINVTGYIDSIKEDLNVLKDLKKPKKTVDIIEKYKKQYEDNIVAKFKEAQHFIEKEISPEMDKIGIEITNTIESLINEVMNAQKKSKEDKESLIEKKKQLQNALQVKGLINCIKIFGQVVSILGPWGIVAGSVISVGISIADSSLVLSEDSLDVDVEKLQLPQSVSDLDSIKDQIICIKNQKVTNFHQLLDHMSEETKGDPEKFRNLADKISEIKNKLSKAGENEFSFKDFKEIGNLKKELKDALITKEGELIKSPKYKKNRDTLIVIDKLKKSIELSSTVAEAYLKDKNDQGKLNEIDRAIKEGEMLFDKLREYEQNIYTTIAPLLHNLIKDLNVIQSKLGTKSKVALDVTKWNVQNTLKDMKTQMQQLTEGFKSKQNLVHSIEKLNDAMNTLIIVYDHIKDLQGQQKFANYIADISSADANNINISNKELRDAVTTLEITIRSSIILERYKVAVDAFKQFVFPFAHIYFKDIELPNSFELQGEESDSVLEHLVEKAATQIDHIKSKHANYKLSITKPDGYVGTGEFSSNYQMLKPFFTWKNEFHKNMIRELLSGQEVIVKADIVYSPPDKDAIKFNVIDLKFKVRNGTMQSKINKLLEGFEVSATHLGNSYYCYNDKIYLITTNSQPIWYYFTKNDKNEPIHKGGVYDKISAGEFMLSPYASWKIKLSNITDNISFENLKIFIDEIDLELGGHGHYLNKRRMNELELIVDKYYDAVNRIDVNSLAEKEDSKCSNSNSYKNKRDVDQVVDMIFEPSFGDHWDVQTAMGNGAEHASSSINFLFGWLKKRSIALISKIGSVNILDTLKTVTDNYYGSLDRSKVEPANVEEYLNDDEHFYQKQKEFASAVEKYTNIEAYITLASENNILGHPQPQKIDSNLKENVNKYNTRVRKNYTNVYEQDFASNSEVMGNYPPNINTFDWNNSKLHLSGKYKINNSQINLSFDGWGSLMLAHLVVRSITKENHKQNYLALPSPMVEKSIELYHLEQKVNKGLNKMSFLYGD